MNVKKPLLTAWAAALVLGLSNAGAAPLSAIGTINTPDGKLYYETRGRGPAIILVAGGPGSSRVSLRPEFDQLENDHTVVYFDNIGRGRSSPLPAGRRHSPDRDAEDIEHLRKGLGLDKVDLLGHSYGGYPALAYAGRYPQHLRHLVISSSGHSGQAWQRNIDNVNRFVENQYPEAWARLMALRGKGQRSCSPEYQAIYGEPIAQLYWHDATKATRRKPVSDDPIDRPNAEVYCAFAGDDAEMVVGGSLALFDARPKLARVRVPTYITAGRYDPVMPPKVAFEIAEAFPAGVAQVQVYENSAHRPWVEEEAAYFAALRRFLDKGK